MPSNSVLLPPSVLCVAHDRHIQTLLRSAFNALPRVMATNAFEAVRALHRDRYALAAIDVLLPDWDGFALCRTIRNAGRQLPVILLCSDAKEMVKACAAGAQTCIAREADARLLAHVSRAILAPPRPAASGAALGAHRGERFASAIEQALRS
jgi:two-component system, OmpR family, response regulator